MIIRTRLLESPSVCHGFFTRQGGVSTGIFASLNCSLSSADDLDHVRENRRRAMEQLGVGLDALATVHQVHSSDVAMVDQPWPQAERPRADAMVTTRKGVALGILTADCGPVLFADESAGVIGAAHAGWRGAVTGVMEATIDAMVKAGARKTNIAAAIGPCIGFASYEVGAEFPAPFLAQDPANAVFFRPAKREGHHFFDLSGYLRARLKAAGIIRIEATGGDTCAEPERFFSYRRTCLEGEKKFGHGLSAICLAP
jgi:YfiH family protein